MHRSSKVLYGVLATILGIALTACDSSAIEEKPSRSEDRTAGTGNGKASPGTSTEWSPALAMGQSAPGLFEPQNAPGGKFQVALDKIVKGTQEQMEEGHLNKDEFVGGTTYFVYVTYTLKGGQTDVGNLDLNAHAAVLDENGEEAAKRPVITPATSRAVARSRRSTWAGSSARSAPCAPSHQERAEASNPTRLEHGRRVRRRLQERRLLAVDHPMMRRTTASPSP